MNLFRESKMF